MRTQNQPQEQGQQPNLQIQSACDLAVPSWNNILGRPLLKNNH